MLAGNILANSILYHSFSRLWIQKVHLHHPYFSKSHAFFVLFFLRHLTLPGSLVVGYSSVFADPVPFTEITTTKWELWIGFKGEKEIKTRQTAYVTQKPTGSQHLFRVTQPMACLLRSPHELEPLMKADSDPDTWNPLLPQIL